MSASKTSLGPLPLLEGVSITVSARHGGGWLTTLSRGDEVLVEDHAATLPWVDPRGAGRLAAKLHEARPALDQKAIKAALLKIFEDIKKSPDGPGLVSAAVSRAIGETVTVQIELCDPPVYTVTLEGGRDLTFSARVIAAHSAISLNEAWLSVHPREPLNATCADFEEVITYWLSIAEEIEPVGDKNPWEAVAEKLQMQIAGRAVSVTKEGLADAGLYQEEGGPLWVSTRIIQEVLKDAGRDVKDSGFSRYLRSVGVLMCPSRSFRVMGLFDRAWGFLPDFKPEDAKITNLADLPEEDGEDQS
jgi:hypothetical protein